MKKLFFLSAMIGLMAGTAAAIEIYSCNTVGVQRVTGTLSKVVAPVPFCAIGGGDLKLSDALYTDSRQTTDIVQLMDGSPYGFYSQWTLLVGFQGVEPFYPSTRIEDYGGSPVTVQASAASSQNLQTGIGIIVERGSISSPVYVMGEYSDKSPVTTVPTFTMSYLVNPTQSAFDVNAKLTSAAGVDSDDRILIGDTVYYYNKTGEGGKHWYVNVRVVANSKITYAKTYRDLVINPGEGFIYDRWGMDDLTIHW